MLNLINILYLILISNSNFDNLVKDFDFQLSLWSDRATFTKCAAKSRLPIVQLHEDSSWNVVWQILCRNPTIRMEVIASNCESNQVACLLVLNNIQKAANPKSLELVSQ